METRKIDCTQALHEEIERTPAEYRPLLLRIVNSFREGVSGPAGYQRLLETQEALDDLNAGRVVDGSEVLRWLESWGSEDEQAASKQ